MPPSVSITTVLYNSADHIKNCFAAIEQDVQNGLAELIVVDNASPDNSVAIVTKSFPFAKLIVAKNNLGFSGGCNLGWKSANGRYWLLLNPDTIFPNGGLEKLIKWMDENPQIGVASTDIIDSNNISEFPGRSYPSVLLTLLEMFRLHLILPPKLRGKLFRGTYWQGGDQFDTGWVTGTVMIVRREVIDKVGLLSEKFFMYSEDMEWCWRIKKAGWKIGVCNSVKVIHHGRTSSKKTWGETETNLRQRQAIYLSIKETRGNFYSMCLLLLDTIAQLIESIHPFRQKDQKLIARKQFELNKSILRDKLTNKRKLSK